MSKNIPVVILCGGKGTRLKEETEFRPKPMVLVGDRTMILRPISTKTAVKCFWGLMAMVLLM